ncbi:DNA recombination protein RmuC [Candidatus Peregrinibacteria bacterium]|nr:DNA recombination protein RmuC [Candidatus Peregrinibacteria bacterium]
MTFAIGLLTGFLIGGVIAYWLGRRSTSDAATIAESLTDKVFSRQAEKILQLAEAKLSGKKDVIDGTLKAMKGDLNRVEDLMRKIGDGNVQVGTRLDNAAVAIKELSETTGGIRNALSSNNLRGNWGERMAEDVLRLSGLIEGINFIKQTKLETGSKPDFTFMLPQKLKLNMDVKFPFNNYQLYVEAKTDRDKEEHKEKFLKDVRKRVKEVQTRDYINPEDGTVDYVLLFVPNEQIFSFINEIDRTVIDEAMRGKTILCSPLSLYAILAVIRQSIDSFSMESKSQEMLTIFGAFRQQWEKFKDQMETVKERFESVHKGYEELTGARERQLDRQLQKIDEIRSEKAFESPIEAAGEKAKMKALSEKRVSME